MGHMDTCASLQHMLSFMGLAEVPRGGRPLLQHPPGGAKYQHHSVLAPRFLAPFSRLALMAQEPVTGVYVSPTLAKPIPRRTLGKERPGGRKLQVGLD